MILFESSRDNLLQPYVDLYNAKVAGEGEQMTVSKMKQILLRKFVNEALMRNLSLDSNYYLAGVARYYFHGDLTTNKELNVFNPAVTDEFKQDVCTRLNAVIVVLRNAYIDTVGQTFEQPEDFGTLSIARLLRKYNKAINAELGIEDEKKEKKAEEKPALDRSDRVGNGYTFDILYCYEDATKYYKYTEPGAWCITYADYHYKNYVRSLNIHYVIFRKDGFENVERKKGPDFSQRNPRDEYGNSLIALLQSNVDGRPIYITSRWNHGHGSDNSYCEADHAYTPEQFKEITGVSNADLQRIFKIWKEDTKRRNASSEIDRKALNAERNKTLRILKYAQMRINSGMNIKDAFADYANDLQLQLLTNAERETQLASDGNTKGLMKLYKNSIIGAKISADNGNYFFIIDRGKIAFDTMRMSEAGSCTSYFIKPDNANFYKLGSGDEKFLIYDPLKHGLMVLDGVSKFKYYSTTAKYTSDRSFNLAFYLVGEKLNKWAAINAKTNEPLILPNGSTWAEDIVPYGENRWSSRDTLWGISENGGVITFVYDSAANENYYYDINAKKFINMPDGWGLLSTSIGKGTGLYIICSGAYGRDLRVMKAGELYDKLPERYTMYDFRYSTEATKPPCNNFIILKKKDNGHIIMFNANTEEEIEIPYGDIRINGVAQINRLDAHDNAEDTSKKDTLLWIALNDRWERWGGRYSHEKNESLLYSIKNKKWLINPTNNSYIFNNFSASYYAFSGSFGENYYIKSEGKFKLGCTSYGSGGEYYYLNDDGTFVKGVIEKVTRTWESKVRFTENDIRAMITECVRRIIGIRKR